MSDAGEKSALEIESEIERTREDMDDTIDAIKRKLSAEELIERVAAYVRNNSGDIAMNVGHIVKNNPAPFAVIGMGLGWLLVSGRFDAERSSAPAEGSYGDYYDSTSDIGGESGSVQRKAAEAYEGISDSISGAMDDVSHKAGAALEAVSERSRTAMEAGRSTARQHPMLLGAAGLAVGLAVALMLPRTHREDRAVGRARDDLVRQAKSVGRETVEKAKDVAEGAWDAAKQTVIDETAPSQEGKAASPGHTSSAAKQAEKTPDDATAARNKMGNKANDAGIAATNTSPGTAGPSTTAGSRRDFGGATSQEAEKRKP